MKNAFEALPKIKRFFPAQGGLDNAGIGETEFGERYLLKTDPAVCLAEYIGASVCQAVGIPCGQPFVVVSKGKEVFGSKMEYGVDIPSSDPEIIQLVKTSTNQSVFSAALAVDVALGNFDRHWNNWLFQKLPSGILARAIDFSRAWPTTQPPMKFADMESENTGKAYSQWPIMNIKYDKIAAKSICARLSKFDYPWLDTLLLDLPLEWKVSPGAPELCKWWQTSWSARLKLLENFLEEPWI